MIWAKSVSRAGITVFAGLHRRRKHFLNAFKAPEARFGLGEAREKIAGTVSPDPELVRIALRGSCRVPSRQDFP